MDFPTLGAKPNGKTVLIWGGSSSVGSTSIQLAKAAGYTVATTASAHNEAYVRSLGATHFFDYGRAGVLDEIVETLRAERFAGIFDCISEEGTAKSCADVLSQLGGGVLPLTLWPPEGLPKNVDAVLGESSIGRPPGFKSNVS